MNYKSKIIKKYGTEVEVKRFLGDAVMRSNVTKALLGRATKTNANMFKLATQKEGIFLPYFDIRNGDYVVNHHHNEEYLVVGTHQEYYGNKVLSIITNLLKCEHLLTVKGNTKVADDRGNLKTVFGVKYQNVPCYFEYVSGDLKQYEPGINPDTEYRVYVTDLRIDETDQVEISVLNGSDTRRFKVLSTDYVSFPNMVVLEVCSDTVRK